MASLTSTAGTSTAPTSSRTERNERTQALIAKLGEADDALAQILDLAAAAIDTLLPGDGPAQADASAGEPIERFEAATTDYFALLNDIQLFLRSAVFHLVHHARRTPLTPAQTSALFDPLRAATASKGHALRPADVGRGGGGAGGGNAAYNAGTAQAAEGPSREGTAAAAATEPIDGLPDDALLSLGALRIQHKAWADLAAALEALQ